MSRIIYIVLVVSALTSCTSEEVYHAVQNNQQLECEKLPYPQRDECMKHASTDYKDYENERKKLREKK